MVIKDYFIETLDKNKYPRHPLIESIGYERRERMDDLKYIWECKKSNESVCIFQYTVAGCGELKINEKTYKQSAGDVFLIERPGPYKYYLAPDSDLWEFKFINFTFPMMTFWNPIVSSFGHIFSLRDENNDIMRLFNQIFAMVEGSLEEIEIDGKTIIQTRPFETFLDNSMQAYQFITTVHKYLLQNGISSNGAESVQLCIEYICSNYNKNITNYDIAQAGFISPYYLNKRFKEVVGETPLQYLTKIRLKNAMTMLHNPDYTIDTIARQCGFQNANYFTKVYKKHTGLTPSEFRNQKISTLIL